MKIFDIIFALVSGELLGLVVGDFLKGLGFALDWRWYLVIWLFSPIISLLCLWAAYIAGKKFLFIFQAAKHVLVGSFATIIDLKLFESLFWIFSFIFYVNIFIIKAISFLIATTLKYLGNKYWTFQKYERNDIHKEIAKLAIVDAIGLMINVGGFYFFVRILGPQFAMTTGVWTKLSVIFAACGSAIWNFSGYKFLVFNK